MCNLYSITSNREAIHQLARAMMGEWIDHTGNLEPLDAVIPDQMAPVVRAKPGGVRELLRMRWGFPSPPRARSPYTTNIRNTASNWWKPYLKTEHRCLVPVTSFCQYQDGSKPAIPKWFAQDVTRPLFFFAGIWREWEGRRGTKANPAEGKHLLYSFVTAEPNKTVAPIHAKAMPVLLLTKADRETWMTGSVEDALALQQPAADTVLRIVAEGSKKDGLAA